MGERTDLVILGGGLAGLALAERLARSGAGGRVRILEPRENYVDDRSWAFWTPAAGRWSAAATRSWTRWRYSTQGDAPVVASAEGWRYVYLRSSMIYDVALRAIADAPHITLERGLRAGAVTKVADGIEVATSSGPIVARHVIDTRPPPPAQLNASLMFQCFAGRELTLPEPGIDDQDVELMTDMRSDALGFVFSYVLPISPTRVLVEATRFATRPVAAQVLAADLDALIAARGWTHAPIVRTEQGMLPMGLPPATPDRTVPNVVQAGTQAGALRASSGYGFLRIQAWAERCAESLLHEGRPLGHPAEPPVRQWMDTLFLRALAANPRRAPDFFIRLARVAPGDALVRFLSDQARVSDLLRIVTALPASPFLRALVPTAMTESRAA